MNVGELFVHLGVKADTYTVKDFGRAISNLPLSVAGAITALTGMQLGFMGLTSHTLDMANSLNLFRAQTGLSTSELQRWQNAAKQAGISGESVSSSIMGIANSITQITRFGNAQPAIAFGRLGIGDWASKTPFQLLMKLRERYSKMNPNEFRAYAQQIGVAPEMMRLFELSPKQFQSMMSTGATMGGGDLAAMAEFQKELAHFTVTVEKSFVPVLRQLTPVMGDLAKALGWMIENLGGFAVSEIKGAKVMLNDPKQYMSDVGTVLRFIVDEMKRGAVEAVNMPVTVTQNIMGVAGPAEAHEAGAQELKRELTRAAKQMNKGH